MSASLSAIPLVIESPSVVLCPESIEKLFGAGYRLKGSEKVILEIGGKEHARLGIRSAPSPSHLLADGLLAAALLRHPGALLRGPAGTRSVPSVRRIKRLLELPPTLARTAGLQAGSFARVAAGSVVFTDVEVAEAKRVALRICSTDAAAAGVTERDTGRFTGPAAIEKKSEEPCEPCSHAAISGRLITENDVRKARMERRKIVVQPGQLITPAARSLGKELGVIEG